MPRWPCSPTLGPKLEENVNAHGWDESKRCLARTLTKHLFAPWLAVIAYSMKR
jgi:hypothetical protein